MPPDLPPKTYKPDFVQNANTTTSTEKTEDQNQSRNSKGIPEITENSKRKKSFRSDKNSWTWPWKKENTEYTTINKVFRKKRRKTSASFN